MPITLLNTGGGIGNFRLINNNNSGGFNLSVLGASSNSLVTSGLLFNVDMQNWTSGTALPDSSGNGNNFTFYGTPVVSGSGTNAAFAHILASPANGAVFVHL